MKPFTFDTFPRGVVYIRSKEEKFQSHLVIGLTLERVETIERVYRFEYVDYYEISTDLCKTWKPFGVETKK